MYTIEGKQIENTLYKAAFELTLTFAYSELLKVQQQQSRVGLFSYRRRCNVISINYLFILQLKRWKHLLQFKSILERINNS